MANLFDRFTDRARQTMIIAQEESSKLDHWWVGTEHLLLGLLRENDGVAGRALEALGVTYDPVRDAVEEMTANAGERKPGPPPFTPRARKVIELAFREFLRLGHNYLSTEHILLGLIREGEGVAVQVISRFVEPEDVRQMVLSLLAGYPIGPGETGPQE